MDQLKKKVKTQTPLVLQIPYDARIIVNLSNPQGEVIAEQLDVSVSTTRDELQTILNELIKQKKEAKTKRQREEEENIVGEEDMIFSFFHQTIELTDNVMDLIKKIGDFSTERTLEITYHPQSLFRIKPITRQTAALEGHTQPVLSVQFRNQGDVAVTASGDTTIRLWDITTETPIHTFEGGHKDWVLVVQWSPDGQYFASGGMDGLVCVWNYETHELCGKPLRGHKKWITSIAWEPLHLDPECNILASSSKDGTVMLWSRQNNICLLTISAHTKCVTKMLFGGNGVIYTASEDTTVAVWQKNGHKISDLKGHAHWVNTLALCTDFTMRTACFSEEQVEKGTKFTSREEMSKAAKEKYQNFLAGKGERLVSGSDDQTLILWEYPKTKPIIRMTGHQQPINHVQFSPDGRFIVSASFDKSLRIWDGYNGSFICALRGHVSPVYQVSWSSDSRMLLSASKDSTLKLWSLSKQKLIFDLPGHADEVYAVDWAPIGGEKAISGGKDRLVKIWRN